jgi:hypothetical protein
LAWRFSDWSHGWDCHNGLHTAAHIVPGRMVVIDGDHLQLEQVDPNKYRSTVLDFIASIANMMPAKPLP